MGLSTIDTLNEDMDKDHAELLKYTKEIKNMIQNAGILVKLDYHKK